MSPPRGGRGEGGGGRSPTPELDALRARLAETRTSSRERRPAGRTRRSALPDEGAEEELLGDPPQRWWQEEDAGRPRPVVGGIAARTRKGPIGATWWSRRFLESLEAVMVGGRMERGRTYARKGQVVDLQVGPGVVTAVVQGSREDPYTVRLRMPVVAGEEWDRIAGALAARAGYAARMLAGELPHEVEEVFDAEGSSLLPAPHARLVTECTCPDWENPCKHIAAVCYLLAEEFDRDPFSLLAWRGRGRDELLGALRARWRDGGGISPVAHGPGALPGGDGGARAPADRRVAATAARGAGDDPAGLLERFWTEGPELAHVHVLPEAAQVPAAVLRLARRGTISVRGGDLADALVPAYREIARSAAARARR